MNVLVVGTSGAVVSGITTAADQTVRTLEHEGFDVHRMSAGTRRRRNPSRFNLENVTAVVRDTFDVRSTVRARRTDVVWYHTFGVPTLPALRALAVVVAARSAGARAFVRLHPYDFDGWLRRGGIPLRMVLRLLDRAATGLVVEFDEAGEALRSVGLRRVHVLANWVDVPADATPLPVAPPWTLAFVGGLIERKGIVEVIDALDLLVDLDVRLLLVGGAGEDGAGAQARIEARAAAGVDVGMIELLGELDASGVRAALRRSHLFVLPTRAEGLPLAMLEAMAEGRPVVVGDVGAVGAVVRGADCGIVLDRVDAVTVADGVRVLLGDPDSLTRRSVAGHRAATTNAAACTAGLVTLLRSPG